MRPLPFIVVFLATFGLAARACAHGEANGRHGVQRVAISRDGKSLTLSISPPSRSSWIVVELLPHQPESAATDFVWRQPFDSGNAAVLALPRFDGSRDRLDSRFALISDGRLVGAPRYPEGLASISMDQSPLPLVTSKKGLQVQMLDDALSLGVQHAALNVDLARLVDPHRSDSSIEFSSNGRMYHFSNGRVAELDQQVAALAGAGVRVYFILLNYMHRDAQVDTAMRHPDCPESPPNRISAFNIASEEGVGWFRAAVEFLAERYTGRDESPGHVAGYIVGNEVNSHGQWYAMGPVSVETLADHYHRTLRVAHAAVRKSSSAARVYISLDHFWGRAMGDNALESCGGKELIDELTRLSRREGDFDWHVAYHPYPENLFEPRSWLDRTALQHMDTPRITFKNLGQLTAYLRRPQMLHHGQPRRVILSEQGFHTPPTEEGERQQAAGFCYAWVKVQRLDGIDAFILHRHVDHRDEGGLNLGLWTRKPGSVADPHRKKRIYETFKAADTPQWRQAFHFALPLIGATEWRQVD